MAITVKTNAQQVSSGIVQFTLHDHSGAHVDLTLAVNGFPPISHRFAFGEGDFVTTLKLQKGSYPCMLVIGAFIHGALNRSYDCSAIINGQVAASAHGSITAGTTFDFGSGQFALVVA